MKPSERLRELLEEERVLVDRYGSGKFQSTQCRAIVRFLDEQHEIMAKLIVALQEASAKVKGYEETLGMVGDADALRAKLEAWKGKIDSVLETSGRDDG